MEEIVVNNRLIATLKPILKGNEITNNVQIQNGLRIYSEIILASFFTHIYFFCIFINICFIMILQTLKEDQNSSNSSNNKS